MNFLISFTNFLCVVLIIIIIMIIYAVIIIIDDRKQDNSCFRHPFIGQPICYSFIIIILVLIRGDKEIPGPTSPRNTPLGFGDKELLSEIWVRRRQRPRVVLIIITTTCWSKFPCTDTIWCLVSVRAVCLHMKLLCPGAKRFCCSQLKAFESILLAAKCH